jgi:hypothetical protein
MLASAARRQSADSVRSVTRRFNAAAVVAIACITPLAACGGDDSTSSNSTAPAAPPADAEAAIEETWAAFVRGVKEGDGAAACAELSDELARPNEANYAIGSLVPGGPSCEDTFNDKQATLSFAAGLPKDFAELTVDGTTADGIAGAAKPTFAETDGEWEITSFYGVAPEE